MINDAQIVYIIFGLISILSIDFEMSMDIGPWVNSDKDNCPLIFCLSRRKAFWSFGFYLSWIIQQTPC